MDESVTAIIYFWRQTKTSTCCAGVFSSCLCFSLQHWSCTWPTDAAWLKPAPPEYMVRSVVHTQADTHAHTHTTEGLATLL